MPRIGIIVVAGGSGNRMGTSVPKQFLPLAGKPVLVHTLERLSAALPDAQIVVALPEAEMSRWREIARAHGLEGTHIVSPGGATRFESVKNGLHVLGQRNSANATCEADATSSDSALSAAGAISNYDIVAVHDGVRPFVSTQLIKRIIDTAITHGTAVPVIMPEDSFREITPDGKSKPIDRSSLRAVQTPQAFSASLLRKAYETPYDPRFTDDASVVEHLGQQITLCEGDPANIKITTPFHMSLASALLNIKNGQEI